MFTRREFLAATPGTLAAALAAAMTPRLLWGATATQPAGAGNAISAARAGTATRPAVLRPPSVGRSAKPVTDFGRDAASITSSSRKSFRILQITDLHLLEKSGQVNEPSKGDQHTYEDCRKYVALHKPDLIVISGDLWFEDTPKGRAQAALDWALKQHAEMGVPWTFCWGNHDTIGEYQPIHDQLEAAPHSLYRGGATHGDSRVEVRPAGAAAGDPPTLDILLMNTSLVGLTAWQVGWYARTRQSLKRSTPALAFLHIPLLQYRTLYVPGQTKGAKLDKVSPGNEDGQSLPELEVGGTLRACFCGHNHINDYCVRDPGGMDLNYGRATGYSGYGGEKLPKGAKLIEVDLPTGNYTQTTIFADGTTWTPTVQAAPAAAAG